MPRAGRQRPRQISNRYARLQAPGKVDSTQPRTPHHIEPILNRYAAIWGGSGAKTPAAFLGPRSGKDLCNPRVGRDKVKGVKTPPARPTAGLVCGWSFGTRYIIRLRSVRNARPLRQVVPVKHVPDANFLSRSVRQRICNGARQPASQVRLGTFSMLAGGTAPLWRWLRSRKDRGEVNDNAGSANNREARV